MIYMNLVNFSFYNKVLCFFVLFFTVQSYYSQDSIKEASGDVISGYYSLPKAAKPGDTVNLEIIISKGNLRGFAKFQCELPQGVIAFDPEIPNTAYAFEDNKVKIIWVEMASSQEFSFLIKTIISDKVSQKSYFIEPQFSYLLNKEVRQLQFQGLSINITNNQEILKKAKEEGNGVSGNIEIKNKQKNPDVSQTPSNSTYKSDLAFSLPTDTTKLNLGALSPYDVVFKVQIAATKKRLDPTRISKIYKGSEKVFEEYHISTGWFKYYIGRFNTYEEAQKLKLVCGVPDAFIASVAEGYSLHIVDALRKTIKVEATKTDIVYSVQIGVLSLISQASKFVNEYKLDRIINIEYKNASYYCSVALFYKYEDALKFKNSLNIRDSFIIAFENGERADLRSFK